MKRLVYDWWGELLLREEDATPQCGKDFCDDCGDCLACYGEDDCGGVPGRKHKWIAYARKDNYELTA